LAKENPKLPLIIIKVSSRITYLKINLLYKETFVLKKPLIQAQFSPFFKKLYVFEINFDLKNWCAHLILEKHFYLTTLQAELRVTTLCIERGVVCGGCLTVKN
jgi:hypothetical protein